MQQKLREISMLSRRKVGATRYLQPKDGSKAVVDFKSSSFAELKEKNLNPQHYSESYLEQEYQRRRAMLQMDTVVDRRHLSDKNEENNKDYHQKLQVAHQTLSFLEHESKNHKALETTKLHLSSQSLSRKEITDAVNSLKKEMLDQYHPLQLFPPEQFPTTKPTQPISLMETSSTSKSSSSTKPAVEPTEAELAAALDILQRNAEAISGPN